MNTIKPIAAIYVETDGCYFGQDGIDAWDEHRDARLYNGPHPVIAHPPCKRWGNFWFGSTSPHYKGPRYERPGMDGGLFADALEKVRRFGGVLEHPAQSRAWAHFGLTVPPRTGGWVRADWPEHDGWTCCVEQGHYGHVAPKATWLYAVGCELPSLKWGPSGVDGRVELQWSRDRLATPPAFRDLLISMARSVEVKP